MGVVVERERRCRDLRVEGPLLICEIGMVARAGAEWTANPTALDCKSSASTVIRTGL